MDIKVQISRVTLTFIIAYHPQMVKINKSKVLAQDTFSYMPYIFIEVVISKPEQFSPAISHSPLPWWDRLLHTSCTPPLQWLNAKCLLDWQGMWWASGKLWYYTENPWNKRPRDLKAQLKLVPFHMLQTPIGCTLPLGESWYWAKNWLSAPQRINRLVRHKDRTNCLVCHYY